jgi:electron transfer flavoprotein beta subunit
MIPFDQLSIEESARIRDKSYTVRVEDVLAFSCRPAKGQDVLWTAMAMGADRGIHVEVKDGEKVDQPGNAEPLKLVDNDEWDRHFVR